MTISVNADLVIRGATIVTMDAKRRCLKGDVHVSGGVIAAVGEIDATAIGTAQVIDAHDHIVMPGFVQAHVHLCQALFRGMADGLPLMNWLREKIWPLEAAHNEQSLKASSRLGLLEMLLAGTTTILDMGTVHDHDVIFEQMRITGIRGMSGKAMMDRGDGVPKRLLQTTKESLGESDALLKRWQGVEGGRIGYAYAPRFILSCTEELMREVAARSAGNGALMHTHAAEHAQEREAVRNILGKDDISALRGFGILGERAVLAHGVQLRDDEIEQLAKDGTRIVHCPSANMKLASGIAPVAKMRAAGVVVGLGADGAPCNNRMDPWTELRQSALLAMVRDLDATAVTALDALSLATIDGARVLGLDKEIGSIEVGKKADLIVVDTCGAHQQPVADQVGTLVYSTSASDVRHVFIGGEWIVRDRKNTRVDASEVINEALEQTRRLARRADL